MSDPLPKTERKAIASSELLGEWRPIETAPKDGTAVLLWAHNLLHNGRCIVAQFIEHDIEYWHVDDGKFGPYPLRGPPPTHWMPTPNPPNT